MRSFSVIWRPQSANQPYTQLNPLLVSNLVETAVLFGAQHVISITPRSNRSSQFASILSLVSHQEKECGGVGGVGVVVVGGGGGVDDGGVGRIGGGGGVDDGGVGRIGGGGGVDDGGVGRIGGGGGVDDGGVGRIGGGGGVDDGVVGIGVGRIGNGGDVGEIDGGGGGGVCGGDGVGVRGGGGGGRQTLTIGRRQCPAQLSLRVIAAKTLFDRLWASCTIHVILLKEPSKEFARVAYAAGVQASTA
ncbi:hypothetical protein T265_06346 [Opisthorchis viverrini]|uniref:Uncharacterized protein n=1 Tax=Opisthorchis viverrini TaxID=6198 RepID=A0A074ZKX0_OPIVI|nr:hypothetical protein T265_06346 [Opisthorchis viverrini]KER26432.1 hypothetical protein T265_06346 [Opisthorchis viverrini]